MAEHDYVPGSDPVSVARARHAVAEARRAGRLPTRPSDEAITAIAHLIRQATPPAEPAS